MTVSPMDVAKWTFWVPLRSAINPHRPNQIHAMASGWRLQWMAAGNGRERMKDEYRKWFGERITARGYTALVQDAYRVAFRTHLEELLIGKLCTETIDKWIQFHGMEHLEQALSANRGVIWVYPHAGPVMLMIAGLAQRGVAYTQYAARGQAPEELAQAHPELLAHNPLRKAIRQAREASENRLSIDYLTHDAPVRSLHRSLQENRVVGIAFDGRIGHGWFPMPFLNRTALLSTGPWKLACSTGAMVVPVFCHSPNNGPATVEVGRPISPGRSWRTLADEVVRRQEDWLTRHPEEYGIWLLHTRDRAGIDDHPLFIDNATDDRYTRWMGDEGTQLR